MKGSHDLDVTSLNPAWVELWVHSTSVPSCTWKPKLSIASALVYLRDSAFWSPHTSDNVAKHFFSKSLMGWPSGESRHRRDIKCTFMIWKSRGWTPFRSKLWVGSSEPNIILFLFTLTSDNENEHANEMLKFRVWFLEISIIIQCHSFVRHNLKKWPKAQNLQTLNKSWN